MIASGLSDDTHPADGRDVAPLEPLLLPYKFKAGRPSIDHRRSLEAALWLARTISPWRDLLVERMNWRTVWRRLQRWTKVGIWSRILNGLRAMAADAG